MKNRDGLQLIHGVASRIGDSHINFPIGYQDSSFSVNHHGVFVGIICDGCSLATEGYTQNQVGAILGAEVIARNVFKYARHSGKGKVNFQHLLRNSNRESWRFFKRLMSSLRAARLRIDRRKFIEEKLLFTVMGLVIVNNNYCFFGCGDGWYGINDSVSNVEDHSPSSKYLEPLLDAGGAQKFTVYESNALKLNDTLWIASDGVSELFSKESGRDSFFAFVNDERVGHVTDGNDHTIQPFRQLAKRYNNRFSDDMTVVVCKARKTSGLSVETDVASAEH